MRIFRMSVKKYTKYSKNLQICFWGIFWSFAVHGNRLRSSEDFEEVIWGKHTLFAFQIDASLE